MTAVNTAETTFRKPAQALTFCTLASGSRGNAVFVSDGDTGLLVDAGLSGIEIQRRLAAAGLTPQQLDAILVTHEHSDHIQGVGVLARRFRLPVYMTAATARAAGQIGTISELKPIESGVPFRINGLKCHPFSLPHDAADPVGFTFQCNGRKLGLATDLGTPTAMIKHHLKDCSALILEANHDPAMLSEGPYPWPLKQRIGSRTGHLSNVATLSLVAELRHPGLDVVVLAHLSETNNTPQKAFGQVAPALEGAATALLVAAQHSPGRLVCLDSTHGGGEGRSGSGPRSTPQPVG
jgi:phosphoribosyl 1,2-cyclic phosphodiesterase